MNSSWIGIRLGLTLNRISSKLIGILFLLDAAISLALAPWVVGREINGVVGFMLAVVLAAIYIGIVRYAIITQSEDMVIQIVFVIISIVVCQLVYAHPATLERILTAMVKITPLVVLAACALFCVGSVLGIAGFGGLLRWVFAFAAAAALLTAMMLVLDVTKIGHLNIPIPGAIRDSPVYKFPLLSALGLGCLGVLFQTLSLRQIAQRFHDSPSRNYAGRFAIYHVVASVIVLGVKFLLRDHRVFPMMVFGQHIFDSATILSGAATAVLVTIDGLWLSRAVAGARDLIDRRRK